MAGKLGFAALVPAKPLGEDGILNQNPIFEMGFSKICGLKDCRGVLDADLCDG